MKNQEIKKPKTWKDLVNHPLIEDAVKNYDGNGVHMISCIDGYKFSGYCTMEIGSVKELCNCVIYDLEKSENEQ